MLKKILFISVILFKISTNFLFAQKTDANIFGDVTCKGEHLPFVSVFIKNTTIGTATNNSGHYMLNNVPEGKHILVAKFIGYKTLEKPITVISENSIEINFELKEDLIMMEQVVVSASKNEVSRKEAPVVVSVISPKLFEATQAITLSESLNFTPGLRVENDCQNCGFTQLRINGLDGNYSQILINSRPIFSALNGVYGLEQIPTNMIERIEVVRGGGSALFGGSAIAGTVNIITKDPLNNTYQVGSNIGIIEGEIPDISLTFNTSLVSEENTSGIFLYGITRKRDYYDANGDDFSEISELENNSFGFRAFYRPSNLSRISLDFNKIDDFRRGGNKFDYLPHETDITEQVKHNTLGGGIVYETYTSMERSNKFSIYASAQNVDRKSYYGANQDPNAYGQTDDLSTSIGSQYHTNFDKLLYFPSLLTLGLENNFSILKDNKLGSNNENNTIISDQNSNTIGAYAQNEWDLGFCKILLGFRFDNYNIKDKHHNDNDINGSVINPRANLLYDINEDIQWRLSYSTGYRSPQIFDEDLHIETSGARRVIHQVDKYLKEEKSQSISSSINYEFNHDGLLFNFLAEGFYTKLNNPFTNEFSDIDEFGNIVYTRVNAKDGAKVMGVNLELNIVPSYKLNIQIGGTIQENKYESLQNWGDEKTSLSKDILRTPKDYAYIVFNYDITRRFKTSINGTYTGKMLVPHFGIEETTESDIVTIEKLGKSPKFFDFSLKLAYDFKLSEGIFLEINGGIQNIFNSYQDDFDKGVNRDAGYVYGPMRPRTFFFGVKIGNLI